MSNASRATDRWYPGRKIITLVVLASFVSALFGLGVAYRGKFDPKVGSFRVAGIRTDGWVVDGTSINNGGLWPGLNHLTLDFNSWRPAGMDAAHLQFSLCGDKIGEVAVQNNPRYSFRLKGKCNLQTFGIKVLNPFSSTNPGDTRRLGSQLFGATVSSAIGVPIVAPTALLTVTIAFIVPALLLLYARVWVGALMIPLVFGIILGGAAVSSATDILFLWGTVIALSAGCCIAYYHPFQALGRQEIHGRGGVGLWLPIIIIVGLAFSFRIYGIDFGLPGRFHPDETPKFNAIQRMVAFNEWNPKYFLHPSFLLYSSLFVERVLEVIGVGWDFNSLVRLSGRVVSALAGTASVLLVYLIGSRLYSRFVGVVASLLLALFPLHITSSRYMKEDALMVMFFLAAMWIALVAVQKSRPWMLVFAGIAAGFCVGTKYTGLLAGFVVFSAPWLASRGIKPSRAFVVPALFGLLCIPLIFFITTPFAILDFEHFAKGFMSERKHMLRGHSVAIDAWSQYWMYHIRRSLLPGMTTLPFVLSGVGVGLLIWRRKVEDLWLLSLLLLFLLPAEWVKAKPAPQPERYMIPCLPILAIILAEFVRVIANSRARKAVIPMVVLAALFPLRESTLLAYEVSHDTRERAAAWMEASLGDGTKVLVDWVPYVPQPQVGNFTLEMFEPGMLISDLKAIVDGEKKPPYDYLILSGLVYNRFFDQPFPDELRRSVIQQVFERLPIVHQERPWYKTYGFHNPTITIFSLKEEDRATWGQERKNGGRPIVLPEPVGQGVELRLKQWLGQIS
jgi:hypothetical protein